MKEPTYPTIEDVLKLNREERTDIKPSDLIINLVDENKENRGQMVLTQAAIIDVVLEVFKRMEYKGDPPESINVSSGSLFLLGGDEVPACYGFDKISVPGRIYVSISGCKKSFGQSPIPDYVASAVFAAHEAVEHVNNMRGVEILDTGHQLIPRDLHANSATEQEANKMAREIVIDKFGWTAYFGDEPECQDQQDIIWGKL